MSAETPSYDVSQAVPFFRVRDLRRSLAFYVDGLGFSMTRSWAPEGKLRWCWLELGGAALMLQEQADLGEHDRARGTGVSISLVCRDALAFYRRAKARGIAGARPFVGNGLWVTPLADPDGYRLELTSPTDAEEESEYTEDDPLS